MQAGEKRVFCTLKGFWTAPLARAAMQISGGGVDDVFKGLKGELIKGFIAVDVIISRVIYYLLERLYQDGVVLLNNKKHLHYLILGEILIFLMERSSEDKISRSNSSCEKRQPLLGMVPAQ